MKDNRHKEPRQKPWGQAERIQTGSRLPKTIAREAWVKSKENLIPAKRTNPDSNYAYAQEMEEDSVQQVENCLEDATLLTLQKAGAAYKDRIARKRELHKPHQEGSLYRNTLEPREKETVVREPSKTNPQGTSKQVLKSQLVILVTCTCLLRILKGLWKRSIFQVRSTPFFCLLF